MVQHENDILLGAKQLHCHILVTDTWCYSTSPVLFLSGVYVSSNGMLLKPQLKDEMSAFAVCALLYAPPQHAVPAAPPQLPVELSRFQALPLRPAPSAPVVQWALGRGLLSWPPPCCGLERSGPAPAAAERPSARAAMGTVHARVGERRDGGERRG